MGSFHSAGCLGDFEIRFYFLNLILVADGGSRIGSLGIYTYHARGVVYRVSVHLVFYGDHDPRGLDV